MSLLPRIPCRKLFIDSRHALPGGTSTEFSVEVPQGGLDMPDNTVMFIDAISIPSFPNLFSGKDRLYIREDTETGIHIRYVTLASKNYEPSTFCSEVNTKLAATNSWMTTSTVPRIRKMFMAPQATAIRKSSQN